MRHAAFSLARRGLRFHTAPGTHVANIHKTLLNRRAFFCFHRLITAGTSNDRRVIHSILHNQPHRTCRLTPQMNFLSASLACAMPAEPLRLLPCLQIVAGAQPSISSNLLEASRNCGAIATLSRFLNSATLRGELLGRMTNAFGELGAYDDDDG